ncbi:MAG: hypothetical protein ACXVEF_05885 [Polyangiales bacterium]
MSVLVACARCRRHARVGTCPFCGAHVTGSAIPSMQRRPTSRRDVLLFATTLTLGCGARTGLPEPVEDAVSSTDTSQLDDIAVTDTGEEFDTFVPAFDTSVPTDDGGGVPIYGAAPFQ